MDPSPSVEDKAIGNLASDRLNCVVTIYRSITAMTHFFDTQNHTIEYTVTGNTTRKRIAFFCMQQQRTLCTIEVHSLEFQYHVKTNATPAMSKLQKDDYCHHRACCWKLQSTRQMIPTILWSTSDAKRIRTLKRILQ